MGLFKNLLLGATGIKTYQNVFNKPIVVPPSGYVIRGMKQKGLGSSWVIKYSKEESLNSIQSFTIHGTATKAVSVESDKFLVEWP